MKVIIAGSRKPGFKVSGDIWAMMDGLSTVITEVVSGKAKGVDKWGEDFAKFKGIHVEPFPANWDYHGEAAGPIRNAEMVKYADALIAFPGGSGTADVTKKAKAAGLLVIEITPSRET